MDKKQSIMLDFCNLNNLRKNAVAEMSTARQTTEEGKTSPPIRPRLSAKLLDGRVF
jgi:hypothetical protein